MLFAFAAGWQAAQGDWGWAIFWLVVWFLLCRER